MQPRPALSQQAVTFAVKSIRRQLTKSPHAVDTAEGIHGFWIEWPEPLAPTPVTEEALKLLEEEGFVERVLVDTRELWRKKTKAD